MLSTSWKNAWSIEIANHLWQTTLVVLVAWMLALALKRYQARIRYWVWMTASLKFLFPFSLLAALARSLHAAGAPAMESTPLTSTVAKLEHPFASSAHSSNSFSVWMPELPVSKKGPKPLCHRNGTGR